MLMCEWDAPEGHSGQCWVHLYCMLSYPIDRSHLSLNLAETTSRKVVQQVINFFVWILNRFFCFLLLDAIILVP